MAASPPRLALAFLVLLTAASVVPPVLADTADARGPVTGLPLPRYVSIRAETANARRGPGLEHRVDWAFVRRGLPVEVTAEYGNWRRVRDADGAGGWVHHSLLSGLRTGLVRTKGPVRLHAGPSEATAVRAQAEPGVVGRISACEDDWCELAVGGFEGWLPRAALWGVDPGEELQ